MSARSAVGAALLGLALASCAPASRQAYPGLVTRKPEIPSVAVASDIVVLRDVPLGAGSVLVDRSRQLGDAAVALVADGMKARHYPVGAQCTASIGQMLDPALHYMVLDSLEHEATIAAVPGGPPPFHLDESLRREGAPARWAGLVRDLWTVPPPRRGQTTHVATDAQALRAALGGDVAAIVTGFAWNGRRGRGGPMVAASSGYAGWRGSATIVRLALVDTRSGELLWSDARRSRRAIDNRLLAAMVSDMVRRLP